MQNLNIQNLQSTPQSVPLSTAAPATESLSFQAVLQKAGTQTQNTKGFKIIVILEHYTNTALQNGQLNQTQAKDFLDTCHHCKHHQSHKGFKASFSYIEKELQTLISELSTFLDPLSKDALPDIQDPILTTDQQAGIQELEQKLKQSKYHIAPETKDVAETLLTHLKKLLEMLLKLQEIGANPIQEKPAIDSANPVDFADSAGSIFNVETPTPPVHLFSDTSGQESLSSDKPSIQPIDPSLQTNPDTPPS